jgi:hypothetical protein
MGSKIAVRLGPSLEVRGEGKRASRRQRHDRDTATSKQAHVRQTSMPPKIRHKLILWCCSNAEILDLIVTSTEVITADITSLEKLVRRSVDVKFSCSIIEQRNQTSTRASSGETTQKNDNAEVVAWQRLSSTLAYVTALRTLRVWLDRSEHHYWTTVDESAIIAPLRPLADRRQLDVCIELPRHYDDNTTTLPFRVTRRLGQRFFGYTDSLDQARTIRKADFPMLEARDFPVDGLSVGELEDAERQLWREGVDIQHVFIDGDIWVNRGPV